MLAASQGAGLAGAGISLEASAAGVTNENVAFDPAVHVHPELRASVPELQRMMQQYGPPSIEGLAVARKAQPEPPLLPQPAWTERIIAGPKGSRLRVCIVNAGARDPLRPAILHTHGGGFISGSARFSLPMVQSIAAAMDCVVVSVDYRLAPETPFPGSLEDNYAGLKWLYDNAAELGVDRSRIAVLGESAGGGHAAMLAIAARDRGEVPLIFQSLIYPMLDDRTGSARRVPPHIGTLLWTEELSRLRSHRATGKRIQAIQSDRQRGLGKRIRDEILPLTLNNGIGHELSKSCISRMPEHPGHDIGLCSGSRFASA